MAHARKGGVLEFLIILSLPLMLAFGALLDAATADEVPDDGDDQTEDQAPVEGTADITEDTAPAGAFWQDGGATAVDSDPLAQSAGAADRPDQELDLAAADAPLALAPVTADDPLIVEWDVASLGEAGPLDLATHTDPDTGEVQIFVKDTLVATATDAAGFDPAAITLRNV